MRSEASPYSILGLDPGADAVDVERAYKRLIKLHHPDRDGGDPGRAAEINRAYRELKGPYPPHDVTLDPHRHPGSVEGRWFRIVLIIIAGAGAVAIATGPLKSSLQALRTSVAPTKSHLAQAAPQSDIMNQPVHRDLVAAAIRDARRIVALRDDQALLNASGECHDRFRSTVSLEWFDRCAAFDDAVVDLQDRDPMWDQGPFSEMSVTGRQWSAASALSKDSLAIDSRLDRIRLQVELALAPNALN
jgi:hypothetical protein